MGIHYDYKSTSGEKAMKKKLKEKLVLKKEEQKEMSQSKIMSQKKNA